MLSPATNDPNLSCLRIVSAQCAGRSDALFVTHRRTTRYPSGTRASSCRPTQKRPDPKVEALLAVVCVGYRRIGVGLVRPTPIAGLRRMGARQAASRSGSRRNPLRSARARRLAGIRARWKS